MTDRYFPEVPEGQVQLLLQLAAQDPGYLDDEDCPYSDEMIEAIRGARPVASEIEDVDPESVDLEAESLRLFLELREHKDNLTIDDHAEKMAYFRTSTSLLEKLVTLRERAQNVKAVSVFMSTVMNAMDEFLEPGQITKVRERLQEKL